MPTLDKAKNQGFVPANSSNYGKKFEQAKIQAHDKSTKLKIDEIATFLEEVLGQRLTAEMLQISNHKLLGKWKNRQQMPGSLDTQDKLRKIYQLTYLLNQFEKPLTVRAWFLGMNPDLDDKLALDLIKDNNFHSVLKAIESYIARG